jgi:hypothetical protein
VKLTTDLQGSMKGRAVSQTAAGRRNYDLRTLPYEHFLTNTSYPVVCLNVVFQIIALEECFLLKNNKFFYRAFTRRICVTVEMSRN